MHGKGWRDRAIHDITTLNRLIVKEEHPRVLHSGTRGGPDHFGYGVNGDQFVGFTRPERNGNQQKAVRKRYSELSNDDMK